jgi:hypothetical protein
MAHPVTYPYRPKPGLMLLVVIFFAACAVIITRLALPEPHGLRLFGLIRLGPAGADIFFWILIALSCTFVGIGVLGLIAGFISKAELQMDGDGIEAPKSGVNPTRQRIEFRDVLDIQQRQLKSQHILTLRGASDKLTINSQFLPNRASFEDVAQRVIEGVAVARATEHTRT